MNKLPKLSIIVPVYNTSMYLEKCIDSLLNQKYKNIEIIVVEDCSTDDSKKRLSKYKEINNVKVIYNKENKGLAYSRNRGIEESSGDYIGFVDSDDYVQEDYYDIIMDNIKLTSADVVITGIKTIDIDTQNENINICYNKTKDKLGYINVGLAASACNKVFSIDAISKYRFSEGKINEDIAFVIPIIVNSNKIEYIDNIYYYYIQRSNSIQNSDFKDKRFDIFYGVDLTLERIKDCDNYDKYYSALVFNQIILLLIYSIINIKDFKKRGKTLKKYTDLVRKYNIYKNEFLIDFYNEKGFYIRLYYKIIMFFNRINLTFLSNIAIEFHNFIKKIK